MSWFDCREAGHASFIATSHPMKTSFKRLSLLVLVSGLFAVLGTSCNTTRGLGRDVKKAGDKIERAAS
jgi:predicted small secreted protein